jgi:hypothetical protein
MRTKTTLLAAALIAAGAVSATAQSNVYSLNVVGYVNVNLKAGFNVIANPLNIPSGNTVTSVFGTNVPDGTTVYKFVNGSYQNPSIFYGPPDNIWDPEQTVNPGQGLLVKVTSNTTLTFTGEVLQGNLTNSYPAGFSLLASQVPQSAPITTIGFPAHDGDTVYFFDANTQSYGNPYIFYGPPDNVWDPAEPAPAVGQAFLLSTTTGGNWSRSFTVN